MGRSSELFIRMTRLKVYLERIFHFILTFLKYIDKPKRHCHIFFGLAARHLFGCVVLCLSLNLDARYGSLFVVFIPSIVFSLHYEVLFFGEMSSESTNMFSTYKVSYV